MDTMHQGSAPAMSAEEFEAAVMACRPRTAIFDCDGTLWAPDTGYGFLQWTLEHELVTPQRANWIRERYRLYEAGSVDEATICGEMVQLYAGLAEDAVREAARSYFDASVAGLIFAPMLRLATLLRELGAEIWAVSSTARLVIEAGVWAGGSSGFLIPPERIMAVELATYNGLLGEKLLAVPTDEAKASALREAGVAHPDVVFGNSMHDAAMLSMAGRAFAVNPNRELAEYAAGRGWACFYPQPGA